jgi:hypothetical protein
LDEESTADEKESMKTEGNDEKGQTMNPPRNHFLEDVIYYNG